MTTKFFLLALNLLFAASLANSQTYNCKKILIVVTNSDHTIMEPEYHDMGCFFPEVVDFYSKMRESGFQVEDIDIVSPSGGNSPIFESGFQLSISPSDEAVLRSKMKNTFRPDEVDPDDYRIIHYAGGYSCLVDFPTAASVGTIAAQIYEAGGIVSAVCDGIAGLVPIKLSNGDFLVKNRKVTANYYSSALDGIDIAQLLTSRGASVDQTKIVASHQRVISAQNVRPVEVAQEVMSILESCKSSVGIAENKNNTAEVQCYPNPATDHVDIIYSSNIPVDLVIFNALAQVVKSVTIDKSNMTRITTEDLAAGIYTLKLCDRSGNLYAAKKIIKQ